MTNEAKIQCAHSEVWELARFTPHPRNVNTHPEEQLRLLGKVIVASGWRSPICVSKRSGLVIKGHGRLAAAKLAGLTVAPVDLQDYADEAAEMGDLIADNRLSALAEIDMTALKDVLETLTDGEAFDVELAGFTAMELERVFTAVHLEGENDPAKEWAGMPEYKNDPETMRTIIVHFKTQSDVDDFCEKLGQTITQGAKYIWHPKK